MADEHLCVQKVFDAEDEFPKQFDKVPQTLNPSLFTSIDLRCCEARQYCQPEPHARSRMLHIWFRFTKPMITGTTTKIQIINYLASVLLDTRSRGHTRPKW